MVGTSLTLGKKYMIGKNGKKSRANCKVSSWADFLQDKIVSLWGRARYPLLHQPRKLESERALAGW